METTTQYHNIQALVASLDFQELARIENKNLAELTERELKYIGLLRIEHVDGELYYCKDLFGANIYFERKSDGLSLSGKDVHQPCCILNSGQLISEALFKWRLKGFGLHMNFG